MMKVIWIKQLTGIPWWEGEYIWCVCNKISWENRFFVTHSQVCSSEWWARTDCLDPEVYDESYKYDNTFFDNIPRSGHTLEMCHYESMDILKEHLLS
jgi:hypothetical protein